ncbi:uncharacterized protein LOC131950579 [Physella acuta]|uniref:uncharacterized protein LOC131950579 n=1 Tax=Physella acuta TaxID=109671 RepID=UPI0027DCFEE5|nr:uncharacterized protein LOC131950579 [Physella acuta]
MENTGGKKRELQSEDEDVTQSHCQTTKLKEKSTETCFIPGYHEAEICYGGEADLHKHYTGCKKNPGHVNFIPVNDFNLNHLPLRYQDDLMLDVIKALSGVTVMIKVKYTSPERPKYDSSFNSQYPFYNIRGSDMLRTGTGRVWYVDKNLLTDRACPCGRCQHSDTPSKVWGKVEVLTARHVVFDDSEARQTECIFSFNDTKRHGVSLDGLCVDSISTDIVKDNCVITCATCDLELLDELEKNYWRFRTLHYKMMKGEKYPLFENTDRLTIIVSHPHGCPQQVSVGQWTHKHERGRFWRRYVYTTCTCPGTSGAYVYTPAKAELTGHTHSGTNSDGNYSGEWVETDATSFKSSHYD